MNDRIKRLKLQVEAVLQDEPETRNSDIALTIAVWRRFYGVVDSVDVEDLYKLPREDNVKRLRAMFNAEGRFLPTRWDVAKRRGIEMARWRTAMQGTLAQLDLS